MKTFKHSGTFGDLVYGLHMVKKMDGGHLQVAIENIENCVARYGYKPQHIDTQHKGKFSTRDFEMLAPLLERQSYVKKLSTWHPGDAEADVELDEFRNILYRTFEGNILEAYHRAFGIPFSQADIDTPWLEADKITVAPIVVTRSSRYRPPNGDEGWKNIIESGMITDNSVFVGTPTEHEDFQNQFGIKLPYHAVTDFLELASVINGANMFVGNQGFAYSLAIGLGKPTVLEINKIVPIHMNECFFARETCKYF
jgi:hypothetical protein